MILEAMLEGHGGQQNRQQISRKLKPFILRGISKVIADSIDIGNTGDELTTSICDGIGISGKQL